MKKLIIALMLLSSQLSFAGGFPDKIGIVNDYEGVLAPKQEKTLNRIITKYQKKTGVEMIVVSTKSFNPANSVKQYILGLFKHWGYTPNQTKNGVLILFSFHLKELQIIPGYDIKTILTEKKILSIVNEVMKPKFLKEKYFSGLKKGIKAIYKTIENYRVG